MVRPDSMDSVHYPSPQNRAPMRVYPIVAALLFAAPALAQHEGHNDHESKAEVLGVLDFPTTASTKSHDAFVRGVLLMHSFHYDEAAEAFREAQHLDSTNVMGYWGEAMTYTHPVWNEQDTTEAHKVLQRLAPRREARAAMARNPREREWLDAVETLYAPGGTKAARDTAYSLAMAKLHASDPGDVEGTTFYALSLLGLNQGDRDVATYRKAYELVAPVFKAHPKHPGAAHYLIHAVDDPEHAALGLDAANAYSEIAPSAGHAIHMTSHVFLALGKWDDVVSANIRAQATIPDGYLAGHVVHWLHYGLIQTGRYREADVWLDSMMKQAASLPVARRPGSWGTAGIMATANVVDTHRWNGRSTSLRLDPKHTMVGSADNKSDFAGLEIGYGLMELQNGNRAAFDDLIDRMQKSRIDSSSKSEGETWKGTSEVMEKILRGYAMWKDGNRDGALSLFRDAAVQEASLPIPFGPPEMIKPPREAAGELLLEMKRPAEAKQEFTLALARTPERIAPLLGLARAEKALGNKSESRQRYAEVAKIWHNADKDIPELAEVHAGMSAR
jgi:tetratricopeptide (TPR) repeat protein